MVLVHLVQSKSIREQHHPWRLVPTHECECRSCVLSGPDHHWSFETTYSLFIHNFLWQTGKTIYIHIHKLVMIDGQSCPAAGGCHSSAFPCLYRSCPKSRWSLMNGRDILAWTTEEIAANLLEYHAEHARIMLHNCSFTRCNYDDVQILNISHHLLLPQQRQYHHRHQHVCHLCIVIIVVTIISTRLIIKIISHFCCCSWSSKPHTKKTTTFGQ